MSSVEKKEKVKKTTTTKKVSSKKVVKKVEKEKKVSTGKIIIDALAYTVIIASVLSGILYGIISFIPNISENLMFVIEYYLIGTVPVIFILYNVMKKKEKDLLKYFSFKNHKLLIGYIIGFLMNGACILVAFLNKDISFVYNGFNVLLILFAFISVFIQSASEEIMCRTYIMGRLLKNKKSFMYAAVVNSIVFSLLHIFNPGITPLALITIFGFGMVASYVTYRYKNVWCASAIHAGWNFTQNFIFGLPNSGLVPKFSILSLSNSNNSLFYNIEFGVESTITALIILFLVCVLFHVIRNKKVGRVL